MKVRTLLIVVAASGGLAGLLWMRGAGDHEETSTPERRLAPGLAGEALHEDDKPAWQRLFPPSSVPAFTTAAEAAPDAGAAAALGGDLGQRFLAEGIDPTWGPAMEDNIRERFAPAILRRLAIDSLRVTTVGCRASICHIILEYPRELMATMAEKGLPPQTPPVALVEADGGPIASVATFGQAQDFESNGRRFVRQPILYGFHGTARDAARHAEWSRAEQPRMAQQLESLRAYAKNHPQDLPEE